MHQNIVPWWKDQFFQEHRNHRLPEMVSGNKNLLTSQTMGIHSNPKSLFPSFSLSALLFLPDFSGPVSLSTLHLVSFSLSSSVSLCFRWSKLRILWTTFLNRGKKRLKILKAQLLVTFFKKYRENGTQTKRYSSQDAFVSGLSAQISQSYHGFNSSFSIQVSLLTFFQFILGSLLFLG